jgi:hypothetical protein
MKFKIINILGKMPEAYLEGMRKMSLFFWWETNNIMFLLVFFF